MNRCDVSGDRPDCKNYEEGHEPDCEHCTADPISPCCSWMDEFSVCTSMKAITAAFLADLHCPPDCTHGIMGHPWNKECALCVYGGHVGDQYKKFQPEEEKKE